MTDKGEVFSALIRIAYQNDIKVLFTPLEASDGRILGNKIAIRCGMGIDNINYNLAHELAHYFLHYNKGILRESPLFDIYEAQADKFAKIILNIVDATICGKGVSA
ncbi:MAG TPA: ImmA/IrrE family metallo-endopeptidase [Candidatus Blautia faecipullorum]|nr:ImmA/IrrE family metallo-endopeptidase [Candidatus Blautia faecipullorum]